MRRGRIITSLGGGRIRGGALPRGYDPPPLVPDYSSKHTANINAASNWRTIIREKREKDEKHSAHMTTSSGNKKLLSSG